MRIRGALLLCLPVLCAVSFFVLPALASAEEIASFTSILSLTKDSSITVTEEIVYDFGEEERHGIFRDISREHPEMASSWYKERYLDIEVISAWMDDAEVPYETDISNGNVHIQIGDADKTVTGKHTYALSYLVRGGLTYTPETEVYWNATGDEWKVPIKAARVVLTAPKGTLGALHSCYVGEDGSTESCTIQGLGETVTFESRALSPGEGLTIAHEVEPGTVETVALERIAWFWFFAVAVIMLVIALCVVVYRTHTKHKIDRPVVAQYEPYAGVEPMYAGLLIDNRLDPKDITAAVIFLAEQGYLKITKIDKKFLFFDMSDYRVELLRRPGPNVGAFLPQALALLFGAEAGSGASVTLSEIRKSFSRRVRNHSILEALRSALREDMRAKGFLEETLQGFPSARVSWISWTVIVVGAGLVFVGIGYAAIFVIIAIAVVTLGIAHWMRRTRKGYEAQNHLKGFKEFLSVTGKDRFTFHNAPSKRPEQFLEFLPYAIAFGVEKEWATVFADVTIPNPAWYDGGAHGAFSAVAFSSDMSAFSSSLGSASGVSASSGGGSSGGGAGGGGGGSW
ncbi:DUF2207 domain-containing protein [Candidatus Kaiserbacteria bacterium]|nr:DUF2207 domain-containing protein [Candidatus Kaiserbacteria bacterium]